jgi:hypothetical protein
MGVIGIFAGIKNRILYGVSLVVSRDTFPLENINPSAGTHLSVLIIDCVPPSTGGRRLGYNVGGLFFIIVVEV